MPIFQAYKEKSVLETLGGVAIFTFLGSLQSFGLLYLADAIPPMPNERGWEPGIIVDDLGIAVLLVAGLFAGIFYVFPRAFEKTSFSLIFGSYSVFFGYVGVLGLMLLLKLGLNMECSQDCFPRDFFVAALAQGTLLSLSYGFWINPLEPDLPDSATDQLKLHLRKWERVFQIVLSIALVTGLAIATQYFLNTPIGAARMFILVFTSGFTVGALALFPILKIHLVTEKMQRGLETMMEKTNEYSFLT